MNFESCGETVPNGLKNPEAAKIKTIVIKRTILIRFTG